MINATIPAPSHRSCSRRARVPSFHPSPMTKPLRRDVSWHDFRSPIHVNLWALLRPWRPPEHSFYEHTSAPTLSRNSPRRLSTDLIPKVALWYNAIHTNSYLSNLCTGSSLSFSRDEESESSVGRERGVTTRVAPSGGCRAAYCQNICRFHGADVDVPGLCALHGHAWWTRSSRQRGDNRTPSSLCHRLYTSY